MNRRKPTTKARMVRVWSGKNKTAWVNPAHRITAFRNGMKIWMPVASLAAGDLITATPEGDSIRTLRPVTRLEYES